jgi:hypothetical protein
LRTISACPRTLLPASRQTRLALVFAFKTTTTTAAAAVVVVAVAMAAAMAAMAAMAMAAMMAAAPELTRVMTMRAKRLQAVVEGEIQGLEQEDKVDSAEQITTRQLALVRRSRVKVGRAAQGVSSTNYARTWRQRS